MISRRAWRGVLAGLPLAVLLAGSGGPETVCLTLSQPGRQITYPVAMGEKITLNFAHSIYGSQVEEQFRVGRRGFESVKLRYSELRLVEFYGHESATQDNGWWIVENPWREISALDLHVSEASSLGITFAGHRIALGDRVAGDGRVRLTATACPRITYD